MEKWDGMDLPVRFIAGRWPVENGVQTGPRVPITPVASLAATNNRGLFVLQPASYATSEWFAAAAGKTSGIAGSLINTSDAGNEAGSELESENLGGRAAGEGRLRALGWPSPTGGEGQVGSESLPPLVRHLSFLHPRLSPRPRRFSRRRLPSSPPPSPPCQVPGRRPLIRSTSPGRVPQHRRTTPSLAPLAPLPLSLLYSHRRQESKLSRGRRTPRDNQHWAMASFPLLSTPIHLASAHDQPREEALTSIASHLKSRKLSPLSLAL